MAEIHPRCPVCGSKNIKLQGGGFHQITGIVSRMGACIDLRCGLFSMVSGYTRMTRYVMEDRYAMEDDQSVYHIGDLSDLARESPSYRIEQRGTLERISYRAGFNMLYPTTSITHEGPVPDTNPDRFNWWISGTKKYVNPIYVEEAKVLLTKDVFPFIRACRQSPDDDAPALVLAGYLEDHDLCPLTVNTIKENAVRRKEQHEADLERRKRSEGRSPRNGLL
jgi:hypothetical protein